MYTFTFVAHPAPSNPRYGEADGAYATVFVNDPVAASAEAAARGLLGELGWEIEELDDWAPMNLGDDDPGTEWHQFYQEARRDGLCVVLHTWPVGAPEE